MEYALAIVITLVLAPLATQPASPAQETLVPVKADRIRFYAGEPASPGQQRQLAPNDLASLPPPLPTGASAPPFPSWPEGTDKAYATARL
jgi:hypothetical protein